MTAATDYAASEIVDDVMRELARPGNDEINKRICAERQVVERLHTFERNLRTQIANDLQRQFGRTK